MVCFITTFITCLHFTHQIVVLELLHTYNYSVLLSWSSLEVFFFFSLFWNGENISLTQCYFFIRSYASTLLRRAETPHQQPQMESVDFFPDFPFWFLGKICLMDLTTVHCVKWSDSKLQWQSTLKSFIFLMRLTIYGNYAPFRYLDSIFSQEINPNSIPYVVRFYRGPKIDRKTP